MQVTLLTEESLLIFKQQLLLEIKELINHQPPTHTRLKSADVRKKLGCKESKLAKLRKSGELPFTQVGATCYYKAEHVENLLDGKSNQSS